jgi:hypothetical protein
MTTVKVWIKKPGQKDDDAVGVDIPADSIVQTLKEVYLGTKEPSRIAVLVLKFGGTELSNRRTYQSYLDESPTLANATLVAEDGDKTVGIQKLCISQKLWQIEGITPGISFICNCSRAIETLCDHILSSTWVHGGQILVQAPPATGKTSLVTLLRGVPNLNVVSVSMLRMKLPGEGNSEGFHKYLSFRIKIDLSKLNRVWKLTKEGWLDVGDKGFWEILDDPTIWKQPGKVIMLIDEAQMMLSQEFADGFFQELKSRQEDLNSTILASVFFSIFDVDTAEAAIVEIGGKPSGSKGNWVLRFFHSDLLRWTKQDADEFFNDFNSNNGLSITIHPTICLAIYKKCDGHAGFITTVTRGIHEYCKAENVDVFNRHAWVKYLRKSFIGNLMSLRSSNLIRDLLVSHKLQGCAELCQKMMLRPFLVGAADNVNFRYLTKLGLVSMLGDNQYAFSSQVVRMLILRHLVSTSLVSPANVLFNNPLELLLFCLPLIKQRAIENCLSKAKEGGVEVEKEDVWVSQLYAVASAVLPPNCFIDPQFACKTPKPKRPAKKKAKIEEQDDAEKKPKKKASKRDHGEVDIIVHNGHRFFLEFLITESAAHNPSTETVKKDILEHLQRFSSGDKYRDIVDYPSAVINVTHHDPPPSIEIPEGFTVAQLYHFVVDKEFQNPKLIWEDLHGKHCVQLTLGVPVSYNPETKLVTSLPFGELAYLADS